MGEIFNYYRDIIPDPSCWEEIVQSPLPTTFWVNTLKCSAYELQPLLQAENFPAEMMAWNPNALRGLFAQQLGNSWPYLAGLLQIQEEVSMLPGFLLDAKPGEIILDLCAAPGNKTAQLAVAMQNQGTLIANDRDCVRMRAFGQIQKRLGLMNVSTTIYDATSYPRVENYFDKVLADVPCSCEGTFRKGIDNDKMPNRQRSLQMTNTQIPILKKAVQCCKPGGIIVYSTCTFAPEENEGVIHRVLTDLVGEVELQEIRLPNFVFSEGITEWRGEKYDSSLKKCMRVWPHQNNTGGFFVAVLRKNNVGAERLFCEASAKQNGSAPAIIEEHLQRFDFAENLLQPFRFDLTNNKGHYCLNVDHQPPDKLKLDTGGLFFLKTKMKYPKFSTAAIMLFGKWARKNFIEITREQLACFYQQQEFVVDAEQLKNCAGMGYVAVLYRSYCLGAALYFPERGEEPSKLRSLFPSYLGSLSASIWYNETISTNQDL